MHSEDGAIVLAYDGELYNGDTLRGELEEKGHRFTSSSAFEAALHSYEDCGTGFLSKLNGKFSLALYDGRQRTAILASDKLGIKPVYYMASPDSTVFSSEMKAVLQHPIQRRLDARALNLVLSLEYVPLDMTLVEGVRKLASGTFLEVCGSDARVKEYPTFEIDINRSMGEESCIPVLKRLLEESVSRRYARGERIGAFLSGGMDSSCVVALLHQLVGERLRTYSVSFGQTDDGASVDAKYASMVAKSLGTEHTVMHFDGKDLSMLPHVVWALEEPMSGVEPYLMREYVARSADVIFSGRGGDELFGGQGRSAFIQKTSALHDIVPDAVPGVLSRIIHPPLNMVSKRRPGLRKYCRYIRCISSMGDKTAFYLSLSPSYVAEDREKLYSTLLTPTINEDLHGMFKQHFRGRHDFLSQMLLGEVKTKLGTLLCSDEKLSSWAGVSERAPMTDPELVRFAFTIPPQLKVKDGTTKYILRKAMSGLLPSEVIHRRKGGGFAYDVFSLMNDTPLGEIISSTASGWNIARKGYIRPEYIEHIIGLKPSARLKRHYDLVLYLAALEVWNNIFVDSERVEKPSRKLEELLGGG